MRIKLEKAKIKAEAEERERSERIAREEAAIKKKQAEFNELENKLGTIMPLVNEANLIGAELGRHITFSVKMVREMPEHGTDMKDTKTEIMIRSDNKEDGWYCMWDTDKFENRVSLMQQCLNTYFDTEVKPDFTDKKTDPWWDPIEPIQVGTSYIGLRPLCYNMGSEEVVAKVLSSEGKGGQRGFLKTEFDICDA